MKTRKLLCPKCLIKIRTADSIYKRERRKILKAEKLKQNKKIK